VNAGSPLRHSPAILDAAKVVELLMKTALCWLVIACGAAACGCADDEREIFCDGPALAATRGAWSFKQACRSLCEQCFADPADAAVCVGDDAGAPRCPCGDDGNLTLCWVSGEIAIRCDASVCE
jgi:hypothetical protein